ncbi:MAG: molybdopterin-binding protein [Burkholderiales bacterium]|jgi:molybdopterin-biosynthesis enzyme MoeA-like protein
MASEHLRIGLLIIGDEILSGKRQDRHFAKAIEIANARGLSVCWSMYLSDDPQMITDVLSSTMTRDDVVFSFGGIGATPDDHTRQCAARAAGVELVLHPEAQREIEAQFGAEAYPRRIEMGVFPAGSRIIPNAYNRIPGFSVGKHHFLPGFPSMAWAMMEWVLDSEYLDQHRESPPVDIAVIVMDAPESQLINLMNDCLKQFPACKVFSLPTLTAEGRRIELGVKGEAAQAQEALTYLQRGVTSLGYDWQPRR